MATNKRIVLTGRQQLEVQEEAIPKAPAKGLVVKTHYAGMCHNDVHLWMDECCMAEGKMISFTEYLKDYTFPRVLGHEIAGEVYEIGGEDGPVGAPDLKVGDHVLVYPYTGCGSCPMCLSGEDNLCEESLARAYGSGKDGGYQAYVSVSSRQAVQKLPPDLGLDVACMLACGALTAYNAITAIMPAIEQGDKLTGSPRLLIVGAGSMGLWAVQWAKTLCPPHTKVYVADVTNRKLADGKRQGADQGILWSKEGNDEEVAEQAIELCGGKLDASVDFVGSASTTARLYRTMRNGGIQALVGLAGGSMSIPILPSAINMVRIYGVYAGTPKQMEEVINLVVEKKVRPPPVHVFKPDQCDKVLQILSDGKMPGRAILNFINN